MTSRVETLIRAAVNKGVEAVAAANCAHLPARDAHPFLSGIHRPMKEELTLTDLEVTGSIAADPAARIAAVRTLDGAAQEFPRIDERRFGQPYRHAYSMALEEGEGFAIGGRLYKHDVETGHRQIHDLGPACRRGEFVFVPAHAHAKEDEGWLVGLVIDTVADTTDLAIIDARRFEDAPVARVHLPHRVPPGFHGNWHGRTEVQ